MNISKKIGAEVNFHYLPTDKFTTDYFSVHFVVPLRKETVSGYSLLSKLFKRGCASYPTQAKFAKRLEELYDTSLYISTARKGEAQIISLGIETLSSRFVFDETPVAEEGFRLLLDVITDPHLEDGVFPASSVLREKTALRDQLRATLNNKNAFAIKRCREIMCEDEAYSLSIEGTEESIEECTPSSLYSLYQKMCKEASIEIFYIGSEPLEVAETRAKALAERLFERTPCAFSTEIREKADRCKRVTEEVDAVQGKLAIGFRAGLTPKSSLREKDALLLFNIIFGASPVSKLFMNVREKLSLCYYCATQCDSQKGVLIAYSGVENKNVDAAEKEILRQLTQMQKGNITEEEMTCAKQAFRDMTRAVSDSASAQEQWYLTRAIAKDDRTPEEMNLAIESLSLSDVVAAAKRISPDTVFFLRGNAKKEDDADVSD